MVFTLLDPWAAERRAVAGHREGRAALRRSTNFSACRSGDNSKEYLQEMQKITWYEGGAARTFRCMYMKTSVHTVNRTIVTQYCRQRLCTSVIKRAVHSSLTERGHVGTSSAKGWRASLLVVIVVGFLCACPRCFLAAHTVNTKHLRDVAHAHSPRPTPWPRSSGRKAHSTCYYERIMIQFDNV